MHMTIMNGKELRDKTLKGLKKKVDKLGTTLGLAVIQVGTDEASTVYVNQKRKWLMKWDTNLFINYFLKIFLRRI